VTDPARVLVADDQAPFRTAVRRLLARCADLQIVGEAADGAEAVRLVEALAPDLVLLDVRMPELDGPGAASVIRERFPGVAVVLCSSHGADDVPEHSVPFVAKELLTADVLRDVLAAARAAAGRTSPPSA